MSEIKWIKFDKDNAKAQLRKYVGQIMFLAVEGPSFLNENTQEKYVTTDFWDGEFEEYPMRCIHYVAPFTMPEYPMELDEEVYNTESHPRSSKVDL